MPTPIETALREYARTAVTELLAELGRPELVTQRTVERVVGMPAQDFLRAARAGSFPSWKERRLVYAKACDVLAYVHAHPVTPKAVSVDVASEQAAFARVGARRVA